MQFSFRNFLPIITLKGSGRERLIEWAILNPRRKRFIRTGMEEHYELPEEHLEERRFPSTRFIIGCYGFGALLSLALAFATDMDSMKTTNCLVISWILALGCLGMSVLTDVKDSVEDLE